MFTLSLIASQQISARAQYIFNVQEYFTSNNPSAYHGSSSIEDSNGNIYLLSNTLVGSTTDISLSKIDASGNTIWVDSLDGHNLNDYGVHLTFNGDGDVLICGATQDSTEGYNILIAQYDTSGSIDWTYEYNAADNLDDIPTYILSDENSNIYVAGGTNTHSEGVNALILKLDNAGNFQWDDTYDESNEDDSGVQLDLNDGKILMSGGSETNQQSGEYFVLEYNSSGTQTDSWTSPTGVDNVDYLSSMKRSQSGNLYLCGGRQDDLYVVALDTLLDTLWTFHHDHKGSVDLGKDLCIDQNENIYVTGYGGNHSGGKDALLLKLNSSGILEWERIWKGALPDSSSSGFQVFEENHKVFMLASVYNVNRDLLVAQIDSSGQVDWYDEHHRGIDSPQSLHHIENGLRLFYNSFDGSQYAEILRNYELFQRSNTAVTDTYGSPLYLEDELIVQFKEKHLDTSAIDDLSLRFGELEAFLDSTAVAQIESLNELTNTEDLKIVRIVNQSRHEKFSISRSGYRVPMPEFYRSLLLSFPEDINEKTMTSSFGALGSVTGAWVNKIAVLDASSNDSLFSNQLSLQNNTFNNHVEIEDAWEIETGKSHVRVGVFDSGIMWEHEDFIFGDSVQFDSSVVVDGANFTINRSFTHRQADIRKLAVDRSTINDHGTAVSGIAGAIRNNNKGIPGIAGGDSTGNRGVRLVDVKVNQVLGLPTDDGIVKTDFILAASLSAGKPSTDSIGFGLHVANHSYGFYGTDTAPLLEQAYRFLYRNGITQVASRGNKKASIGRTKNAWQVPACFPDSMILSVGGSGGSNGDLDTNYSLYGRQIDLCAPGGNAQFYTTYGRSALPPNAPKYTNLSGRSGTSFSAPHVAGIAALIYSYLNDRDCHSRVSHEDVEFILTQTANDKDLAGEDSLSGFGLASAKKALELIEWPYNRLYHIDSLIDTSALSPMATGVSITISDEAGSFANGLQAGTYTADVYEVSADMPYTPALIDGEQANYVWKRLSATTLLPNYSGGDIYNRHSARFSHAGTLHTWNLEGYVYKIDLGSGNYQWIPDYVNLTGKVHLGYSMLSQHNTDSLKPYSCDTITQIVDVPTRAKEQQKLVQNASLKAYPNPSNTSFTLEWVFEGEVKLFVYDLSGRKVFSKTALDQADQLRFSPNNPGVYFIQISDTKQALTRKVIKL